MNALLRGLQILLAPHTAMECARKWLREARLFLGSRARPIGQSPDQALQLWIDDEIHDLEGRDPDQTFGAHDQGLGEVVAILDVNLNAEQPRDVNSTSIGYSDILAPGLLQVKTQLARDLARHKELGRAGIHERAHCDRLTRGVVGQSNVCVNVAHLHSWLALGVRREL
jgi:hypothetical protein